MHGIVTGLARLCRQAGARPSRPPGVRQIRSALQRGDMGMRKIARHLDVATGMVQRIAREMAV